MWRFTALLLVVGACVRQTAAISIRLNPYQVDCVTEIAQAGDRVCVDFQPCVLSRRSFEPSK